MSEDIPKIQLESLEDLTFIEDQIQQSVQSFLETHPHLDPNDQNKPPFRRSKRKMKESVQPLLNKWTESVFEIIRANVQINGMAYEEALKLPDISELDENLRGQVNQAQSDMESLLLEVIERRKAFPQILQDNRFQPANSESSDFENDEELSTSGENPRDSDLDESTENDLKNLLDLINELKKEAPITIAKYDRALKLAKEAEKTEKN